MGNREWRSLWHAAVHMLQIKERATAQPKLIVFMWEHGPDVVRADFPRKAVLLNFHVKPIDFIILTIPIKNRWAKQKNSNSS